MSTQPTIVSATIHPSIKMVKHQAEVTALLSDGTTCIVFNYYDDELTFTADEFTNLTLHEAFDLFRRKDIAYIQS